MRIFHRRGSLLCCALAAVRFAGDPLDNFSNEPPPNGARINVGAFGNTVQAAVSN
jgi:hypothetical protein